MSAGDLLRAALPRVVSRAPGETEEIGAVLAKGIYPGLLVLLLGDLGAGKTLLVRAVGGALGARDVRSPTFAIESVHALPGRAFRLVHADLYRLRETAGAVMQLEEYLDDGHAVLVEWGERWERPPLTGRWEIALSRLGDDARGLCFSAFGERAAAALSAAYAEILDLRGVSSPCR